MYKRRESYIFKTTLKINNLQNCPLSLYNDFERLYKPEDLMFLSVFTQ